MNLTGVTDVVCQADQAVTCATSDLQHPLAVGDPERPNTKVTDCVFARIGNEIVRAADPIIETSRTVPCRLSFCHEPWSDVRRIARPSLRLFERCRCTRRQAASA